MGKKRTAFVFIITTSLVMMAFTAIPHHHHGDQICFERLHKISREHNHEDNDCNDPDQCILNRIIEPQNVQIRECDEINMLLSQPTCFNFLYTALRAFITIEDDVPPLICNVPLEGIASYSFMTVSSSGLRAPPVI